MEQWRSLEKKTADIAELINLATEESDTSFIEEIRADIGNLAELLDKLELELAFSGGVRFTQCDFADSRRGGRYGIPGLGRDVA